MRELTDNIVKPEYKNNTNTMINHVDFDIPDHSVVAEKAAAKIFPLNILSSQFKSDKSVNGKFKLLISPLNYSIVIKHYIIHYFRSGLHVTS